MAVFYTVRRNSRHVAMYGENDEGKALALLQKLKGKVKNRRAKKYADFYACCRHITNDEGRVVYFAIYNGPADGWNMDIDIDLVFGQ